jgi:hypothetical protein
VGRGRQCHPTADYPKMMFKPWRPWKGTCFDPLASKPHSTFRPNVPNMLLGAREARGCQIPLAAESSEPVQHGVLSARKEQRTEVAAPARAKAGKRPE